MMIRHQAHRDELLLALGMFVAGYEGEHGEITEDEMAAARGRLGARSGAVRMRRYHKPLDGADPARSDVVDINDLFGVLYRPDLPPLAIEEINDGISEGAAESGMRGTEG